MSTWPGARQALEMAVAKWKDGDAKGPRASKDGNGPERGSDLSRAMVKSRNTFACNEDHSRKIW